MTRRAILTWPDARLHEAATPVGEVTPEIRRLAHDMLETMYAAPGRGLAATQIGVALRVFVMDATWREGTPAPQVMIDPEIVARGAAMCRRDEGCLSLPGITAAVERPGEVTLRYTTLEGERVERAFTGFAAACVQHETDHLDGRLCIDLMGGEECALIETALDALTLKAARAAQAARTGQKGRR